MWINGITWLKVLGGNNMKVLEAFDLYRFYHTSEEETLALRGVTLSVEAGEIVAIMGPSGSGKSTLLSCLAGLEEPDGGYVQLLGKRLTRRPETERAAIRAADIGIMLQNGNLFNHLSVQDNILLQMGLGKKVDKQKIHELILLVGLESRRYAFPKELSGGEAARASLAVALSTQPHVLLADEPTSEIDKQTEKRIFELFDARRRSGGATLIATHSPELSAFADRIICLQDGRVVNE